MSNSVAGAPAAHRKPLRTRILSNWQLYAMLLVPVLLTGIYKYIPTLKSAPKDHQWKKGSLFLSFP